MYLVKIYDPEVGDLDDVLAADSLDEGVGAAVERVGQSPEHSVAVDQWNGYPRVQITRGDIVVASIEDAPTAAPAEGGVVDAVNDMFEGRLGLLRSLFVTAGEVALAGEAA